MSPTVFRMGPYRFFFFSKEEERLHVHVICGDGEAKFWLEPEVELAHNHGMSGPQVNEAAIIVEEHANEIRSAWERHFGDR